jgi:hypothetical protein
LVKQTLFQHKGTQARLTPKRLAIMLVFLPVFFVIQAMHWIGFLLDEIFFNAYRDTVVKEPLFIVGVPRSGTTFLHRVLANDTERFTTFTLWELLFAPSVTERKVWLSLGKVDQLIGSPFAKTLAWLEGVAFHHLNSIHRISLNAPEEDYFTLVPIFACFLLVLPFPCSEDIWKLAYFDDQHTPEEKQQIMAFYRSCLQRHLYVRGPEKQLLSKNVAFSPMIVALSDTFPDCKVICNIRSPFSAIPSLISSMISGARIFDNDLQGHVFRDQLLHMLEYYYQHLTQTLPDWPEDRHAFVTMEELKDNVQDVVKTLYERFGYPISPAFEQQLQQEQDRSRRYTSRHKYSLEQFEIPPERIADDFAYIFKQFGFSSTYKQL